MTHLVLNRRADVLSCELVKVLHCFMFRLAVPDDRADPNGTALVVSGFVQFAPNKILAAPIGVDPDHLKGVCKCRRAETWFEENDPEGVAF